jgi:hypothetical protein
MGPNGKGAVHRLALIALQGRADVLTPASPEYVCRKLLEAAVEH